MFDPDNPAEAQRMMQLSRDSWRVFRILSEFVEGFEKMTSIGPSVTLFGSARIQPDHPYYQLGVDAAHEIASRGLAIITGGGPGLMEAANKGAKLAARPSCGLCVDLPFEDDANPFVDREWKLRLRYFFVRKVLFIRYAHAFVFLPGGVGTLDEMFEALTLIQTQKIKPFPVILMGSDYWQGLIQWLKQVPLAQGCIGPIDLDRMILCDDPKKVADIIEEHWKKHAQTSNF